MRGRYILYFMEYFIEHFIEMAQYVIEQPYSIYQEIRIRFRRLT